MNEQELLKALKNLPKQWRRIYSLGNKIPIRLSLDGRIFCPLTAVIFDQSGEFYSSALAVGVAIRELDMEEILANRIIEAADCRPDTIVDQINRNLRTKILKALRGR